MVELCAVDLDAEENCEDILLQRKNQGGGRQRKVLKTEVNWLPLVLKWHLLHILVDL